MLAAPTGIRYHASMLKLHVRARRARTMSCFAAICCRDVRGVSST
jgi:hypothetical protein